MAKRNDGELGSLFWMCTIFGGALLGVSIFYSAWETMPKFWQIVGYVALGVNAALIALIFAEMKDPNYDKYRKVFCITSLSTLIFIAGFRVAENEAAGVMEEANKNKMTYLYWDGVLMDSFQLNCNIPIALGEFVFEDSVERLGDDWSIAEDGPLKYYMIDEFGDSGPPEAFALNGSKTEGVTTVSGSWGVRMAKAMNRETKQH